MKRNILIGSFSIVSGCSYIYFIYYPSNTLFYNFFGYFAFMLLIFHIGLSIVLAVKGSYRFWFVAISLMVAYPFFQINFPINPFVRKAPHKLSVLTFNVGLFSLDRFQIPDTIQMKDTLSVIQHINFISEVQPDVICFQEFYNNDHYAPESVINKLVNLGYKFFYMAPIKLAGYKGFFGLAIFSKYPIAGKSTENYLQMYEEKRLNRSMFTDIKVEDKIIRIINVHFHSMSIRINQEEIFSSWDEVDIVKEKMKLGFKIRAKQLIDIEHWFKESPYPVILTGDFNDTPFSFNYTFLRKYLINTFEEIGTGPGFTYHHFPYFIRIDNQFHSAELKPTFFEILDKHKASDHYAIMAGYTW